MKHLQPASVIATPAKAGGSNPGKRPSFAWIASPGLCRGRNDGGGKTFEGLIMKIVNSLKSARSRDKNCRIIRRRGRLYVINKKNPRFKARQG